MTTLLTHLQLAFEGHSDWPAFAVNHLGFKAVPRAECEYRPIPTGPYSNGEPFSVRPIAFVPGNLSSPSRSGRLLLVEVNDSVFQALTEREVGPRLRRILRYLADGPEETSLEGAMHLLWLPIRHADGRLKAIEIATLRRAASGKASEDVLFRHRLERIGSQLSRTPVSRLEGFAKALHAHQDQRVYQAGGDLDPSFLALRSAVAGASASLTLGTTDFLRASLAALFDVQALNETFFSELSAHFGSDILKPFLRQARTLALPEEETRVHALNLLMRLLFLRFLEAKGWIHQDEHWLLHQSLDGKRDIYSEVLEPVFKALSLPKDKRPKRLSKDLPYLNGGLFDPDSLSLGGLVLEEAPFHAFRTFLYQHAFTLEESTPLDQRVAIDPEMLGRVFETLVLVMEEAGTKIGLEEALERGVGTTRRKRTGSYYTPRVIVQYLCRETLDAYLVQSTGEDRLFLEQLRTKALDPTSEGPGQLRSSRAKTVENALDALRVCDPGVGSGAFLVGMMQEILLLRQGLALCRGIQVAHGGTQAADWKRQIITECLYGVDLNPEAVEICRLRLWLSLVIDADGDEPLPNLDFRIVCGDSLVDRLGEESFPDSIGGTHVQAWAARMDRVEEAHREAEITQNLKARFAREEDPEARRELRKEIQAHSQKAHVAELRAVLDELVDDQRTLKDQAQRGSSRAQSQARRALELIERKQAWLKACLDQLKKDGYLKKPFFWKLAFPEVFERGGFDIVVGNPPYVRQELLDGLDQVAYQGSYPMVANGTADLLTYFMERGHQILKVQGHLGFITSNKYMRAKYGENLRTRFPAAFAIRQIIDFADLPVFEVAAYPALFIAQKGGQPSNATVADLNVPIRRSIQDQLRRPVDLHSVREALNSLEGLIRDHGIHHYDPKYFKAEGWVLESPEILDLLDRLLHHKQSQPLGTFAGGRMYRGIVTGLNEAFVIDEATRAELIRQDAKSAELIKPWLRGKDVKRWKPEWAGLYVIFTRRGTQISHYPAIKKYLEQFKEPVGTRKGLTPADESWPKSKRDRYRKPGTYQWFEIQDDIAYFQEFDQPKVIWPEFARRFRLCFDEDGMFTNNKCYIACGVPKWFAGVMNSSIIEFTLCMITNSIRGGFMQVYEHFVNRIPIITPLISDQRQLIALIDRLSSVNPDEVEPLEEQLNNLVYKIYGLNPAERRLIESWFEQRSFGPGFDDEDQEDASAES